MVNSWSLLLTLVSSNRDVDGSAITRPDSPVRVSLVDETATLTVTVQTAVPSARASEHRLRGGGGQAGRRWGPPAFQTSRTSSNWLPTYHKQFTVGLLGSLEFIYGEHDAVPHLSGPRGAERVGLL